MKIMIELDCKLQIHLIKLLWISKLAKKTILELQKQDFAVDKNKQQKMDH